MSPVEGILQEVGAIRLGDEPRRALTRLLERLGRSPGVRGAEARLGDEVLADQIGEPGPWPAALGPSAWRRVPGGVALVAVVSPAPALLVRFDGADAEGDGALAALGMLWSRVWADARVLGLARQRVTQLDRATVERQRELARARAQAEHLASLQETFLALLSHDLRSPLAVVLGQCQLLAEGLMGSLNPKQQNAVGSVQRNARRMNQMVEDLLDRFRAGLSPTAAAGVRVDVSALVREVVATWQEVAERRGSQLSGVGETARAVVGDIAMLREVLSNLIDNALRYTPAGGSVEVRVLDEGDRVLVRVKDGGVGFPEELLNRDLVADERPRGGLGLPLSARLIRALGGQVLLTNDPGGGGVATLSMPALGETETPPRLLLVSSSALLADELTNRLAFIGDLVRVDSLEAALVELVGVDVVIFDELAGGLDALRRLREDDRGGSTPVVWVGASAGTLDEALAEGAYAAIVQPLEVGSLEASARAALAQARALRAEALRRARDPISGLLPFDGAAEELTELFSAAQGPIVAAHIDVKGLREVNRAQGVPAGDQLLAWLAGVVNGRLRGGELALRLESDELLALLRPSQLEDAEQWAKGLREHVITARPRLGSLRTAVDVNVVLTPAPDLPAVEQLVSARRSLVERTGS
ncbi:ATP-binding protein [Myxococcota bacterium]|nr:ATP-binding protein [Myxococcota bacterium]